MIENERLCAEMSCDDCIPEICGEDGCERICEEEYGEDLEELWEEEE